MLKNIYNNNNNLMSDRFSSLKSYSKNSYNKNSNNEKSYNEKSQYKKSKYEKNTFKQKKSKGRDTSSNINNNNNLFTKNLKEDEFSIKFENFPELVKNDVLVDIDNTVDNKEKTYLEKIRETKYQNQKRNEIVPKGWTILQKGINTNKKREEINISEYYNPSLALEIMYNREKYREELNELLGDISPYWNTIIENDDEDEYEDEYYNDNEDYNSSDYCEDF